MWFSKMDDVLTHPKTLSSLGPRLSYQHLPYYLLYIYILQRYTTDLVITALVPHPPRV
jgi:hypothetical protein